jgi:hypothetical protein
MVALAKQATRFWLGLSTFNAFIFGCCWGFTTSFFPGLIFAPDFAVIAFFLYFPFHVRLMIIAFLVLLSEKKREEQLGLGFSAIGGFFTYIFKQKYGLFCVGCLYAILLSWWLLGIG